VDKPFSGNSTDAPNFEVPEAQLHKGWSPWAQRRRSALIAADVAAATNPFSCVRFLNLIRLAASNMDAYSASFAIDEVLPPRDSSELFGRFGAKTTCGNGILSG
jgi:hypothetical protein